MVVFKLGRKRYTKGRLKNRKFFIGYDVALCSQSLLKVIVRNSHVINIVIEYSTFHCPVAFMETICQEFLSELRKRLSLLMFPFIRQISGLNA